MALKQLLASFAVSRLAKELYRDGPRWAAGALVRVAAGPMESAAGRAFAVLVEGCKDPRVVGTVIHECLAQCHGQDGDGDVKWSSVAAPLLLGGGSPCRLARFLDQPATGDRPCPQPEDVVRQLMSYVSFDSPRRPDLEGFLSSTDQPLILDQLRARWSDAHFLPTRIVTDVGIANPHLVPSGSGMNVVLLAVAKDRQDLLDFTRADTVDALLRGTRLPRTDLADKFRRLLRVLPSGAARERLCKIASAAGREGDEAVAATIEAGYVPEQLPDRVVFLFLTEQWDRYDTVDPTGDLLYGAYLEVKRSAAAYAERHHSVDLGAHGLTWRIIDTARRNGRPDPAARYLDENPPDRSRGSDNDRGPAGGYSSDYGIGGSDGGGGGGGGGWTGGGFHA